MLTTLWWVKSAFTSTSTFTSRHAVRNAATYLRVLHPQTTVSIALATTQDSTSAAQHVTSRSSTRRVSTYSPKPLLHYCAPTSPKRTIMTSTPLTNLPPIPIDSPLHAAEIFPTELPPRPAPTRAHWYRNARLYIHPRPSISPPTHDVEMGTMPQQRYENARWRGSSRAGRAWWTAMCSVKIGYVDYMT